MDEHTCPICCNKFTEHSRKPVTCPSAACKYRACKTCVMKYLEEDTYEESHCMKCREPWADAFVMEFCTKKFWNGPYKLHKQRVFMDKEKNSLKDVQKWVKHYRMKKELERIIIDSEAEIKKLENKKKDAYVALDLLNNDSTDYNRSPKYDIDADSVQIITKTHLPYECINNQFIKYTTNHTQHTENKDEDSNEITKKYRSKLAGTECPLSSCRGFIMDDGSCGTCFIYVCAKCRQTKKERTDNDHVCKIEDIDSVKFLLKDTKPCPNCSAPIHKIAGCSHMWCTVCKTAFCWNTLRLINPANAHNPHLVAWLIENGGGATAHGIVQGRFNIYGVDVKLCNSIREKMKQNGKLLAFLPQLYALRNHFRFTIMNFNDIINNSHNVYAKLRLEYLTGYIDGKKWANEANLYRNRINRIKTKTQLFEAFMLGADTIIQCKLSTQTPLEIYNESERLRSLFNDSWEIGFKNNNLGSKRRLISHAYYFYKVGCKCEGKQSCTPCSQTSNR